MSRHASTRRTIRLYAVFASVAAALGIGMALGADPWPGQQSVAVEQRATAVTPGSGYDQPVIRTGQS